MERDEKWPSLPKDFDGKGNCQEKLPYPESQSTGCSHCRQAALFQPFTTKLAVKALKSDATTDHETQQAKVSMLNCKLRKDRMLIIHSVFIAITVTKATWVCL